MPGRKICVVTGSRAEYGLLFCLMKAIREDPGLTLQVAATGMHLSPEFGMTGRAIEEDGFPIDARVETLLSSDTAVGTAKSLGVGVIGFADALDRLHPDLLVLLGDRYEIVAAALAALVLKIPIAHIAGGDLTEGAFDDAIRHSLTKMSHLHFVTNEESRRRVLRMGEDPARVHNVGSPGLDILRRIDLMDRGEIERALEFRLRGKNLLITFHPATLGTVPPEEEFRELLAALETLGNDFGLLFTRPNSDPGGRAISRMIDEFVAERPNAKVFTSMGQRVYLSAMAHVDAVVGNSSSGLYEVPSFRKPTVDIGDRQKGRLRAPSVLHCASSAEEIVRAIATALRTDCSDTKNPYGDGRSSERILAAIRAVPDLGALLSKRFHEGNG